MPTTVVTPPSRFRLPRVQQLWNAREVALRFGARDLALRYRQTALGVIWVVLQPLMAAGVFSIVFGKIAGLSSEGVPFFVFSLAGMVAWSAFSGVLGRGSGALVANQALVSKVFFPRMLVPLSSVFSVLVDFLVGFALLAVLLVGYRIKPGWPVLLAPVWIVMLLLLAVGLALAFSAVMVRYRDVAYIVPVLTQFILYASPVAYALSAVPAEYRWLFELNPLTWALEGFRWSMLGTAAPALTGSLLAAVASVATFVVGGLIFEQMERGFADII